MNFNNYGCQGDGSPGTRVNHYEVFGRWFSPCRNSYYESPGFKAENRPRDAQEMLNLLPRNKGRRLPERAKYLETAPTMPGVSGDRSATVATTVPVSSHEVITQPIPNNLPGLGGNQAETVPMLICHLARKSKGMPPAGFVF